MRFTPLLALAASTSALVVPDQTVFDQLRVEASHEASLFTDSVKSIWESALDYGHSKADEAVSWLEETYTTAADTLENAGLNIAALAEDDDKENGRPGYRRPHKPNETLYQLIQGSPYTTKLAKLVNEFDDVVDLLNGTSMGNITFFAPVDKAFEHIPDHGKKPPKEFVIKILQYHVSPGFYPASRILKTNTVPTLLEGPGLSDSPTKTPQRLSVQLSLRGLTVNFYARVVGANFFGTNGVIHGIDHFLFPPPKATKVLGFLTAKYSTLELALFRTGLYSALNDTSNHLGGTLFAPDNSAWERLGAGATGFLFSERGKKYLAALIKYHVVPNVTLYSDTVYTLPKPEDYSVELPPMELLARPGRSYHVDLPTLLDGKYLSIDIGYVLGKFKDIRINGFNHVKELDAPVYDGVIQTVATVIIPPKHSDGGNDHEDAETFDNISVEELIERLEPYVEQ